MKSVLISIQPKWCELIANGKKTVDVRKTKPKIETPFKCYIYCTNNKDMLWVLNKSERTYTDKPISIFNAKDVCGATKANGKVIGEFLCDSIMPYCRYEIVSGVSEVGFEELTRATQLSRKELYDYCGEKDIYCWHISDLVIYDTPKELSEFKKPCKLFKNGGCLQLTGLCDFQGMTYERYGKRGEHHRLLNAYACLNVLKRPPQSWCYVEEGKGGAG